MALSIRDIANSLHATAHGDLSLTVIGMAEPREARSNELALAMSEKYAETVKSSKANAALLAQDIDWKTLNLRAAIVVDEPRFALAIVSALFAAAQRPKPGIHPLACISEGAKIGDGATIGPYTVIGHGVRLGKACRIATNCTIEDNSEIGDGAVIHAGVRIGANVTIGDRFIAHANSVIGSDGFSFAGDGESRVQEIRQTLQSGAGDQNCRQIKIHSLGTVVIGDDVEIGACTAIDRGTVSATVIGDGSKLDNQVHIAHNVRIGRDCLICGQVGIAGSATIGDRVILAGMTGVSDHVKVGDDVVAAGAAKIYTRVRAGTAVMGSPAIDMEKNIEIYKNLRRLPRMFKKILVLEKYLTGRKK